MMRGAGFVDFLAVAANKSRRAGNCVMWGPSSKGAREATPYLLHLGFSCRSLTGGPRQPNFAPAEGAGEACTRRGVAVPADFPPGQPNGNPITPSLHHVSSSMGPAPTQIMTARCWSPGGG